MDALNNFELERRRLRVELKKKLPAEEEQQKKLERRSNGQLSHENSFLTTFGAGARQGMGVEGQQAGVEAIPIPIDILDPGIRPQIVPLVPMMTPPIGTSPHWEVLLTKDVDMNDPETLQFYNAMQFFLYRPEAQGKVLAFPATLSPKQRNTVRYLAIKLKLDRLHGPQERYIALTRRATPTVQDRPHLFSPSSIPELGYYRPFPTSRSSPEPLVSSQNDLRSPTLRRPRSMGNL